MKLLHDFEEKKKQHCAAKEAKEILFSKLWIWRVKWMQFSVVVQLEICKRQVIIIN